MSIPIRSQIKLLPSPSLESHVGHDATPTDLLKVAARLDREGCKIPACPRLDLIWRYPRKTLTSNLYLVTVIMM